MALLEAAVVATVAVMVVVVAAATEVAMVVAMVVATVVATTIDTAPLPGMTEATGTTDPLAMTADPATVLLTTDCLETTASVPIRLPLVVEATTVTEALPLDERGTKMWAAQASLLARRPYLFVEGPRSAKVRARWGPTLLFKQCLAIQISCSRRIINWASLVSMTDRDFDCL